ncbi:response regulator [Candidatus Poribacteria bacterium]|nr:response regulator [Candidatus Poribacteria bacterium]
MKRILVIDDERDVLEIVRSVLKTKGYQIRCAEGGEPGLKLAEEEEPDLIICDLMMPRISGLEVIKRLKKHPRLNRIPIVVLSAVASDSSKPASYWAKGLGVDEYVTKPFDPLDLLGRVEYIFRRDSYVSSREESGARSGGAPPKTAPLPAAELKTLSPQELVRTYVESWNQHDFALEYRCMSPELVGAIALNDYIARRQQAYQEEVGHGREQHIGQILEERISGPVAKIVCERQDIIDGRTWNKKATFVLKKTGDGWKILKYNEEPLRRVKGEEA